MTKQELLENVDKYYNKAKEAYSKEKEDLIKLLSPSAAKAAQSFEIKSKEEWLEEELKKYSKRMTKPQLNDCLFSLNLALGYLKTYGLKDYDKDYVLMHLRSVIESIEKDEVLKDDIYSKEQE